MRTLVLNLPKDLEDKLILRLKKEKMSDIEYMLKLIESDLNSNINLGNGFYYHKLSDKFYDSEKEEVILSIIEKRVLLTLLESTEVVVPVDILIKRAWRKNRVSIFSFRNIIKNIRVKLYYSLIKNHSGLGYSINIVDTNI